MPSFEEQYKQLFGKDIGYDPIDIGTSSEPAAPPTPRLDLTDEADPVAAVPDADDFQTRLNEARKNLPRAPAAAADKPGALGDFGRVLGAGTVQTGALALGGLEYAARQAEDVAGGIGREILGDIRGGIEGARQATSGYSQNIIESMSPEAQDRMQRHILSLDPEKSVWRGGIGDTVASLGLKFGQALPATVITLLPAARLFKNGMSPQALTYMGASEGGLSLGGIANGLAEEIEGMTREELLAESPYYKALEDGGLDEAAARTQLIAQAQGAAPLIGGIAVGVISATAGKYLEPVFTPGTGMGLGQRVGRGFAGEAVQEAPQSGAEQVTQNIAAAVFDADRGATEGVAEAMAEGLVIGGLTGGAFTGAFGARPSRPSPERPADEPAGGAPSVLPPGLLPPEQGELFPGAPDPAAAESFESVFGTDPDGVDPGVRAALDERMGDLFVEEEAGLHPGAAQIPIPGLTQQQELYGRADRAMPVAAAGQQELPLRRRERGGVPQIPPGEQVEADPPVEYARDTTPLPGVSRDPRQIDALAPPVDPTDTPSREPVADIEAQLTEMETQQGGRTGVYLSAENVQNLQDQGLLEGVLERGTPMADFAEQGDVMIAYDQDTAGELQSFVGEFPMQEILGYATTASKLTRGAPDTTTAGERQPSGVTGFTVDGQTFATFEEADAYWEQQKDAGGDPGNILPIRDPGAAGVKPEGGDIVVQRRDESGNVVQETLVASEQEAEQVADAMQAEHPNFDVQILTAEASLARREQRVGQERTRSAQIKAEQRRKAKARKKPQLEAAQLLGQAAKETAPQDARRIEGFYPAEAYDWVKEPSTYPRKRSQESLYRSAWKKLVPLELKRELGTATTSDNLKHKRLVEQLGEIRDRVKPPLKATATIQQAQRVSPRTVEAAQQEARARAKKPAEGLPEDLTLVEVDSAYLANLTDDEIHSMSEADLERAFFMALNWKLGFSKKGQAFQYEGLQAAEPDLIPEGAEPIVLRTGGKSLQELVLKYNRPGKQRVYIKRIRRQLIAKQHGGFGAPGKRATRRRAVEVMAKTGAATQVSLQEIAAAKKAVAAFEPIDPGLSAEKKKAIKKERARLKAVAESAPAMRRTGKFDTYVLTSESLPKDESQSDRIQREQRAANVRRKVNKTLHATAKHIEELSSGRFAEQSSEQDPATGELTDDAQSLTYAKAYFRNLIDFATALHDSGNKGIASIREMENIDKYLNELIGMPVERFSAVLNKAMLAESQEQVRTVRGFTDKAVASLTNPGKRAQMTAATLDRRLKKTASIKRMNEKWKTNTYYNTVVLPLQKKYLDSIFADGYPSYVPSLIEAQQLQWVLDNWNIPRLKKDLYDPIRRYFKDVGFEFDKKGSLIIKTDEKGNLIYAPSDVKLNTRMRNKLGSESMEISGTGTPYAAVRNKKFGVESETDILRAREQKERGQDSLDRMADIEQYGHYIQANRIIEKFQTLVEHPRTTIAGLIRGEQRLVRALTELGMVVDTPTPSTVKVKLAGTTKTLRLYGPALEAKTIKRDQAKKSMARFRPFRIPATPKDIATAAQKRGQQELNAEFEFFLERIDPGEGPTLQQFNEVAAAMNMRMNDTSKPTMMNEMLDMISAGLPSDHPYAQLATKIRALNLDDISANFDRRGQLTKRGNPLGAALWDEDSTTPSGQFRYILMNKAKLANTRHPTLSTIHAFLHEATHMATVGALRNNPQVNDAIKILREMARRDWKKRYPGRPSSDMPYGLEHLDQAEFVAEAFSNLQFQARLKLIPYDSTMSLWTRFMEIIKNILGIPPSTPNNLFEALVSLDNPLFTGEYSARKRTAALDMFEDMDPALKPLAQFGADVMQKNTDNLNNARQAVSSRLKRGLNAPLSLMTQRQLHKEFKRFFGPAGENSLTDYHKAWEQRDADNSRLMKVGEDLTREWTKAKVATTEAEAVEFSRVATEASLYSIHPNLPLTHELNAHITSPEQRTKHSELASRWNQMHPDWKANWTRIQKYYKESLADETNLILLNALRGVIATGPGSVMSRKMFDSRYNSETVKAMDLSTEGLAKEFPDLTPEQIGSIAEIASIPTKRVGPYFPMMRYGDFVVYAQRQTSTKKFPNAKDAYANRESVLASDPTLDAKVSHTAENEFTVVVTEKDFRTFESRSEAEKQRAEMIAEYGAGAVSDVQKKDKFQAEDAAITQGGSLAHIINSLEGNAKAQNAIKNWWLQSLSDSSFRKHEITRKNRQGVNYDIQQRNFTNYVKKSSYYRSQLRFGWKMADAFRDIRAYVKNYKQDEHGPNAATNERLGQIRDHMAARDRMSDDYYEVSKIIRRGSELGQVWYLFGPSYWMVNATQPYMVTAPYLAARHGIGGTAAALKRAQGMIVSPLLSATKDSLAGLKAAWSKEAAEDAFNVLDQVKEQITRRGGERADNYNDMLDKLRDHNIIDLSWIAELRDISEGSDTGKYQKVLDATRVMGHLTEVNNRVLSALAAYDLQFEKANRETTLSEEQKHLVAIEFAKEVVAETHFDYSAGNKPLLFSPKGPFKEIAPWLFQFMQWPQHMYAMMISNMAMAVRSGGIERTEALKTLGGIFGTHLLMGGVAGAALQPIKWAMGAALWALGDDDEPDSLGTVASGETFERYMRETFTDIFGGDIGHALTNGVPAGFLGVDISRRVDLGTVYYMDLRTDSAEATIGSVVSEFAGAVPNLAFNVVSKALPALARGEIQRGLEYAAPKFARDISRAVRYANEGMVNNTGDTVIDASGISPWQLFLQTVGFQPAEISDFYSRQALIKDTERHGLEAKNALLKRFRTAGTIEERNRVLEEVAEFNRTFPLSPVTRSALLRSLTGKAEREESFRQHGAALRGRAILYGQEGQFYQ